MERIFQRLSLLFDIRAEPFTDFGCFVQSDAGQGEIIRWRRAMDTAEHARGVAREFAPQAAVEVADWFGHGFHG